MLAAALFLFVSCLADATAAKGETFEFKSETTRLMDIIVNSLYSNRDIFLRELLSNSADALEKVRFVSLKNPGILGEGEAGQLKIKVWFDKEKHELYIQDTGIGMDKDELINNLGTIAESGTRKFLEQQGQSPDASNDLIGQFGVGFFSAFLVADEVYVDTLRTRRNLEDETDYQLLRWHSTAINSFTIEPSPLTVEDIPRGTRLTLKMKDDCLMYLDYDKLRDLILEHSKFLPFEIYLRKETKKEEPVEGVEETKEVVEYTWVHVNDIPVLWLRDKSEIKKEEYYDFFKNGGLGKKHYEDPAGYIHFRGEGLTDYTALIYIPKSNPLEYLYREDAQRMNSFRLYINRVFVTDNLDIVPEYFKFATGILDTDNKLTINLSREMIQHSRQMKSIGKKVTKKIFEWLDTTAEKDKHRFKKFTKAVDGYVAELAEYNNKISGLTEEEISAIEKPIEPQLPEMNFYSFYVYYNDYLKFGAVTEEEVRDDLAETLRFASTYTINKYPYTIQDMSNPTYGFVRPETVATYATLKQYMKRMEQRNESIVRKMRETAESNDEEFNEKDAEEYLQKKIYCIIGPTFAETVVSPLLEYPRALGIEVLFFTNPIDEHLINALKKYKDYDLVDITSKEVKYPTKFDEFDLGNDKLTEDSHPFKLLKELILDKLGDTVEEVFISDRLTDSPALVRMKYGNASALRVNPANLDPIQRTSVHKGKFILDINPNHELVKRIANELEALNESNIGPAVSTEQMLHYLRALLDATILKSGFVIDDIRSFSDRVFKILEGALAE